MPRFGFSARASPSSATALSPFNSVLGQEGFPNVTDDDFSYITSAEIEENGMDIPRRRTPASELYGSYSHSAPGPSYGQSIPDDDVLLIRHNGITYPEHFPAFSIGDGKLLAGDVRDRIQMILDLSDRQANRMKLYYKGRRLSDANKPVREYGLKHNSEVLMTFGDAGLEGSGESDEDVPAIKRDRKKRVSGHGNMPKSPKESPEAPADSWRRSQTGRTADRHDTCSPRDSAPASLNSPTHDSHKRAKSRVRTQSPSGSALSTVSAPAGIPGGPIERLNNIAIYFNTQLVPLCKAFAVNPPSDPKKREEEHRKLSETIMQQVLLKLDAVETSSEEGARPRRKELVKAVQEILKEIDDAKIR